jgi:serine/threonine-protein kinase
VPHADPRQEAPTIVEPAPASGRLASVVRRTGASPVEGSSSASATALVALHAEEAARTSSFGRAIALISAVGLVIHLSVYRGGVPILRHGMTASLVTMGVVGLAVSRWARDPQRYTPRVSVVFGAVCLVTSFVIELYLGIFSSFPCIVALGISIFGLVDETRVVVPLCIFASVLYFVIASLIAFGVMNDPGLFAPAHPSVSERLGMATMVIVVYAAALWQARMSRRATHQAIERSNRAALAAQQREALLAEAHQHLDAALRANEGRSGRWTGTTVGTFRLHDVVGRGGMGEVYAAEHATTGREAAVKLLHARVAADASMVKRFLREVAIASRVHVPNVVEVLEAGEAPDGSPYLAMELLRGHDLSWHLRQQRRLPVPEVLRLVEQAARGLAAAHQAGIVHRDLKPQNLLLHEPPDGGAPAWKILDFGVSKLRESGATLTEGGAIVGTPGYMAPEQVSAGRADARSDVFALAAVAYRALTGQPAFAGNDVQAMFDVVYRQPAAPTTLVPGLPEDVDRAFALALAKRAEDRFDAPTSFAEALGAATRAELERGLAARADAITRALPWGKTQGMR